MLQEMETKVEIPEFTKDDFLQGVAPFEFVYQYKGMSFIYSQVLSRVIELAREAGVKRFLSMYNAYVHDMSSGNRESYECAVTEFDGQPQEFFCNGWQANDSGITGFDRFNMPVVACYHPILPVERLVNVDSGIHKVRLAYKLSGRWHDVIEDKATISDGRAIIGLSKYGINVTSDNAKSLVRFLADVEHQNYATIPETASVGRLGWVDGYGFSPYDGNLVFDGMEEYRSMFESVNANGNPAEWLDCIYDLRKNDSVNGRVVRIVMAASFASALVKPFNCLPFFVHIWGETGAGKSVALMVGASVWANPEIGRYIQTFNATDVGKEMTAAFCNSLPLIIDELQLVKDQRKDFDRMIYQLAEGVGRTRGRRSGGLQKTPTWRNCIITSGEYPIVSDNSGGGSVNRTLEIEYEPGKLIEDGVKVAACLKNNYGFAGKTFINLLQSDKNMEYAMSVWNDFCEKLKSKDAMEKQSASAALVLTADRLIDEWIFQDGKHLEIDDLAAFLKPKDTVDQNARALEFIRDFAVMNRSRFTGDNGAYSDGPEVWGRIDGNMICVIKSKFTEIMQNEGYNASSFIGWARKKGVLVRSKDGRNTVSKYISGGNAQCVCIMCEQMPAENDESDLLPL